MVQGQVTTTNVSHNKDIIGVHTPNKKKQVKISQYTDDSNFFSKNQEPVKNVLKLQEQL